MEYINITTKECSFGDFIKIVFPASAIEQKDEIKTHLETISAVRRANFDTKDNKIGFNVYLHENFQDKIEEVKIEIEQKIKTI